MKQASEFSNEYQNDAEKYIRPEETARCLVNILEENTFVSGSRAKFHF